MSLKFIDAWQFWALLSAVFAALTAIFAKVGVGGVSSDVATLIRTVVVVALLLLIVGSTGQLKNIEPIAGQTWLFLVLSGLATGASWFCYFRALKVGPASLVAPIDKLSVVLVAIIAFTFLGERPSPLSWLGIATIAIGAVIVATG